MFNWSSAGFAEVHFFPPFLRKKWPIRKLGINEMLGEGGGRRRLQTQRFVLEVEPDSYGDILISIDLPWQEWLQIVRDLDSDGNLRLPGRVV